MTDEEKLSRVRALVKQIDFAMLTTTDERGVLHSRPMSSNGDVEFDGDIWFFSRLSSHKTHEIEREHAVNVSFANPAKQTYLSLSGTARVVQDRDKIRKLWKPALQVWFPEGPDTPDIALLKVQVQEAEFWDSPGKLVTGIAWVRALANREAAGNVGEHERVAI